MRAMNMNVGSSIKSSYKLPPEAKTSRRDGQCASISLPIESETPVRFQQVSFGYAMAVQARAGMVKQIRELFEA